MKTKTQKLTFLSLALAVSLVLSYVEALIPPVFPSIPGIKMGLANIVILFLLYRFSLKEAAAVSILRLLISSLLFGNIMVLSFSLSGAIFSLITMWLLKKTRLFSKIGVSCAGAVMHNLGQILVAIITLGTREIGYYFIVLCFTGIISGILIGVLAFLLDKKIPKKI